MSNTKFRRRTLIEIADMICGNDAAGPHFQYRSSSQLTEFFYDADTDYEHDRSTRNTWVAGVLEDILSGVWPSPHTPPAAFLRIVACLMDQADAKDDGPHRPAALRILNRSLSREGFEAFYGDDASCHIKHTGTSTIAVAQPNPHRVLTPAEQKRRRLLEDYLDRATEDELINTVLLPLFRHLGFERVRAAGHEDKALEYGKDIWMRYVLPTQHRLYFGIQAKRGTLDAAGRSKGSNSNVAEMLNQITMMLGHEVFDPELNRRVLVDHAFIVAGGTITKAARNWIGGKLDALRRSQIMFMDREDIVEQFVVCNVPLPEAAKPVDELANAVAALQNWSLQGHGRG